MSKIHHCANVRKQKLLRVRAGASSVFSGALARIARFGVLRSSAPIAHSERGWLIPPVLVCGGYPIGLPAYASARLVEPPSGATVGVPSPSASTVFAWCRQGSGNG